MPQSLQQLSKPVTWDTTNPTGTQGIPVPTTAPRPGTNTADNLFGAVRAFSGVSDAVSALPGTPQAPGQGLGASAQDSDSVIISKLLGEAPPEGLVKAALTPVAGGRQLQMPANLITPIQSAPLPQLDRSEAVGAGNARGQGISNAVSATIGALTEFKTVRDRQKQGADAVKVSRLIQAQSNIDQAQQAYDNAKANKDTAGMEAAQKVLQTNNNIRTTLFSDPKFVKTVEKGFQISLTDPSQNKTPEHGIVQKGIDLFKKQKQQPLSQEQAQALGQRFSQGLPQGLGPNVQAQQQLATWQEQQKLRIESTKALIPYLTELKRSGTEITKELITERSAARVAALDAQGKLDVKIQEGKNEAASAASSAALEELKGAQARLTASATAGDPRNIERDFQDASEKYQKAVDATQKDRDALNKELTALGSFNQSRQQEIRAQLHKLDDRDEVARSSFEQARNFAAGQIHVPVSQMPIPTPHVGDTLDGTRPEHVYPYSTKGRSSTDPTEVNPFTGKKYPRGTSSVERTLNALIHGGIPIVKGLEQAAGEADKLIFRGPGEIKERLIPKPPTERPD